MNKLIEESELYCNRSKEFAGAARQCIYNLIKAKIELSDTQIDLDNIKSQWFRLLNKIENKRKRLMCYHPYLSEFLKIAGIKSLEDEGLKLDEKQYNILKNCAESEDISSWNDWRKKNPDDEIWLSGADLRKFNLLGADLKYVHLEYSNLYRANFEGANFYGANLTHTYLSGANLTGAEFECAKLNRIRARGAIVDGLTHIWHCELDEKTDFSGVILDSTRIEPGLKELLLDNVRNIDSGWWYGKSSLCYILHLSDLHIESEDDADLWYDQLAEDVNEMNCPKIDLLIISGDVSNISTEDEYIAAKHFIDRICQEFKLKKEQIIIVPGNHDINWDLARKAYELKDRDEYTDKLKEGCYIEESSKIIRVRNEDYYKQRFANFSKFYKSIKGEFYPTEYDQQGILHHFHEYNLLILALNSAWEIDHHYKDRAGINNKALGSTFRQLRKNADVYNNCLKIAVWHHPISSPLSSPFDDRIKDHGFMQRLSQKGFRIALHGHIHQAEKNLFSHDVTLTGRKINIIGAGTFGAPVKEWTPGFPLQYNLIKIGENRLTVETRCRRQINGVWQPDAIWTQGPKKDPLPRYYIEL
ncbi:MAG: hypothetical protein GY795_48895 [Desulfobacterales bacterium]|nr:hypothetical protein [Desulfobacterales bacterium]